jgi:predicted amidohydrolase
MDLQSLDFGEERQSNVQLLLVQSSFDPHDWEERSGLYFPKRLEGIRASLGNILSIARQSTADIVVLPELSVPLELLPLAREWSEQTGGIIVAGSHYFKSDLGYIARGPVIIGGRIFFTEKVTPAPAERSSIGGQGLVPGNRVTVFKGTRVGNIAVLICADYLDLNLRNAVVSSDIDLVCVPAFQRNSDTYHSRMSDHCEDHSSGIYIAYANTISKGLADGRSAIFAMMDKLFSAQLVKSGFTDERVPWKAIELHENQTHALAQLDLAQKIPLIKRNIHTHSNVTILGVGPDSNPQAERFAAAIGQSDDRYRRILEFYVAPREYATLLEKIENAKLLFIVGDPGIGKTYTAVRLLRHYFDRGYEPIWHAGLEPDERRQQRQTLEEFTPKQGQVIYFEDPFGRSSFERRESIRRIFGPLLDALHDLDARVVITSRREIFEQFRRDSQTHLNFDTYLSDLNVVKPSYSFDALGKIMQVFGESAAWYSKKETRDLAQRAITEGKLATPLAIRDFVFSTQLITDEWELSRRLDRRHVEQLELFTEELMGCDIRTKLVLSLTFLFGSQTTATLSAWFNAALENASLSRHQDSTTSFADVLRSQLAFRLEQFGTTAVTIRFNHPYYEEAFASAIRRNPETRDTAMAVLQVVTQSKPQASIRAVFRLCRRDSEMGLAMLQTLIPVIRARSTTIELLQFSLQLFSLLQGVAIDRSAWDLLAEVCSIEHAFEIANAEQDLPTVGLAMRYCSNYRRALQRWFSMTPAQLPSFSKDLDWQSLIKKWVSEKKLANSLPSLELAYRTGYLNEVRLFVERLSWEELSSRYIGLSEREQKWFSQLIWRSLSEKLSALVARRDAADQSGPEYSGDPPTRGDVVIDRETAEALRRGRNLLPVGVLDVRGEFKRGDWIDLRDINREPLGVGIAYYSAEEIRAIKGLHSDLIGQTLGYTHGSTSIVPRHLIYMN